MTVQSERALHKEIVTRLRFQPLDAIMVPVPNQFHFPARTAEERAVMARLVHIMKADGQILPGAADIVFLGKAKSLCVELKRAPSTDLLGKRTAAGRLSESQEEFQSKCAAVGVPYVVCNTWESVLCALRDQGFVR
jgi:hypothetical protein